MHRGEEWWGASRRVTAVALLLPPVGGLLVALAAENATLYRRLVREDSLLEWLSVVVWIAGLVAAVLVARRTGGLERAFWILFALACLAAAGEELSWGQRLFDYGTPEAFRDSDKQEEAALHNLSWLESPTRIAIVAVSIAGAVAPWLTRRAPRFLVSAFAVSAIYELVRLPAGDDPDYRFAKYAEWPELCFAGALATLAVWTLLRLESRA